VGPDNTAATFYQGDVANILPAATQGKRYLEYKLFMDAVNATPDHASIINLPSVVMNVKATYQPAPVAANILTSKPDFGADTGNVAVQNGDGDLGLTRTVVFRDDFDNNTSPVGDMTNPADTSDWVFDAGTHNLDPSVVGNYSWNGNTGSDGQAVPGPAGWMRIETGYMQDIYGGAKGGGVRMFHTLGGRTDFEVETEVNVETQSNRMAGLYLWMNDSNFIGISAARRFPDTAQVGLEDDAIINNNFFTPDMIYTNYGTNHVFLRITKKGQIITLSYRDADSPTWRVHRVYNTAGMASGGSDFVPVLAGLMAKSFDHADRDTKFADFNYFQISTVADTGSRDLNFTLPAGATPDTLIALSDDADSLSYQVKDSNGNFVGPDGTAGSTFTPNQSRLPASVHGPNIVARATFSGTNPAGTPYLHAFGVQYANGPVARDSNVADFTAGLTKSGVNVTDQPGTVFPEPALGTPIYQQDFSSSPADWLFSNNWNGKSTPSSTATFTGGNAELAVATPTDTWAPGAANDKPRVFLYRNTPVTGDFQIDTKITFPAGRDTNRNSGIGVIQAQDGATPDFNLDMTNVMNFGPYTLDNVGYLAMLHGDNNNFGDAPHIPDLPGYTPDVYCLSVQKIGNTFTGFASTDGVTYTNVVSYTFAHNFTNMYVGLFSKAWGGTGSNVMDFDAFKFTPLITTGTFESRHLDLGASAAGLTPLVTSDGNTSGVKLQFRAADTEADLASATYAGPDGTTATFYSGTYAGPLTGLAGKRWFQYKATISAGNILNDVGVVGANSSTLPLSRADVATVLKIAAGIQSATSSDKSRYDMNGDNSIDLADAARALRSVNGL
jgi:hypothetical protein